MISTRFRIVLLSTGMVSGLILTLVWGRLKARAQVLSAECEALRAAGDALTRDEVAWRARASEVNSEIAARKTQVLASLSAGERARPRVGPLLMRMKAEHAHLGPANRLPPPPRSPSGGSLFPELMSDPEYNALFAKTSRSLFQDHARALRKLGVNEETVQKAVDLLTEEFVSAADLHNLTGSSPSRPTSAPEYTKLREQLERDTQTQLKQLLGDHLYLRFSNDTDPSKRALQIPTEALERRLSYSPEPLTTIQLEQLQSFEASRGDPRELQRADAQRMREARKTGVIPVDEAKVAFYRSVLTPRQMEAVEELHREREAALKRELLPKYQEKRAATAK
jgi:hypothetical protein